MSEIIDRREFFIRSALWSLGAASLACNRQPNPVVETSEPTFDYFLPQSRNFNEPFIPAKLRNAGVRIPSSALGNFNYVYISKLLQSIQSTDNFTPDQRASAIVNNVVRLQRTGREVAGGLTALKIDEGGYYMTAGHGLVYYNSQDDPASYYEEPAQVYDPRTGFFDPVVSYVSHPDFLTGRTNDIAIFYAPTGQDMKPVPGVSMDNGFPENQTSLWMHGVSVEPPIKVIRRFLYGTVDQTLEDPREGFIREGFIKVRGMIPQAGTSGAPIYDATGKIRGVESRYISSTGENNYATYIGSTLTPVAALNQLLEEIRKGNIHKLPIELPR